MHTELKKESTGPDSIVVPADFKATPEMFKKVYKLMLKLDKTGSKINQRELFRNLGKTQRVWVKGTYDRMLKMNYIEPLDGEYVKGKRAPILVKFTQAAWDDLDLNGIVLEIDRDTGEHYELSFLTRVDRELLKEFEWECRKHNEDPARSLENQLGIAMVMVKECGVPLGKPLKPEDALTPAPTIQEPTVKIQPVAAVPLISDDEDIAF